MQQNILGSMKVEIAKWWHGERVVGF